MKKWIRAEEETRGAVKDKVWLISGKEKALFKPDTANPEKNENVYIENSLENGRSR
jgi:hypothetical protein